MKIETTFLHSKLARRIFWLFVLCALIPIAVLAFVSLQNVTAQLEEQSRRHLLQESRDEALAIFERLKFVQADMELVINLSKTLSQNSSGLFCRRKRNLHQSS